MSYGDERREVLKAFAVIFGVLLLVVGGVFALHQYTKHQFIERQEEMASMMVGPTTAGSNNSDRRARVASSDTTDMGESSINKEKLKINMVVLQNPIVECMAGETLVRIAGLSIEANPQNRGGSYQWTIEIDGMNDALNTGSSEGVIAPGQMYTNATYAGGIYSRRFEHPHDAFKLRIVVKQPNRVTSSWLAVPASRSC